MRTILANDKVAAPAQAAIANFHADVVNEVKAAVAGGGIVVVGMAQNPIVKGARKFLADKGLTYKYLEYGSYMGMWKPRLAIKLWSGWPTFPQVFIDGQLIGGFAELKKHLAKN